MKVKICGVTNLNDALTAAELGADAIGLNFYPGSPRCVSLDLAQEIVCALPPFVQPVGVFANETVERIEEIVARLGLTFFQWHGDHPPLFPARLRAIPAFAASDALSLRRAGEYVERCRANGHLPAAILVDAAALGGTGRTLPWDLLADFDPGVPLILAGGLTPDNVADAVRQVRPYAVDVASGVESRPGVKDIDKMRRFIEQASRVS